MKLSHPTRNALVVIFILLLPTLYLTINPTVELAISSLFYDVSKRIFYLKYHPLLSAFYHGVPIFVRLITIGLTLIFLSTFLYSRFKSARSPTLFLLLALITGPMLIVHNGFKNHSARPRPSHCIEFGGNTIFQPAFSWEGSCKSNCSFVSGHASAGFYLTGFAWIWTQFRKRILAAATFLGLAIGTGRIIQGAHFASDILFCGVVVIGCNLALAELWYYLRYKKLL